MPSRDANATIIFRREVNPRLLILRIAPDGWQLPSFTPGQYATFGIPAAARRIETADAEVDPPKPDKLLLRAYSIASASVNRAFIEVYVNLVDSGTFTPRLFALQQGDKLWLKPTIKGMFTLDDVPKEKDIVMIATGTGLAPYMSMLRTHADGAARRCMVLLGARHVRDLGYHEELLELSAHHPHIAYCPAVSRPEVEVEWTGHVGYVQDLWQGDWVRQTWGHRPTPETSHVFLCGNPAMVSDMKTMLGRDGFVEHSRHSPGQIHTEEYW
ncbi:MAG: hypothetical protein A2289_11630 [Deltaproteobacteria bacterium RIFOXYA12_FULL_58_15]|nr:MAG: hypothetical protein A2289_11630 [Deltaproteobacteria bacterium RIFOXYA12_FULL_58_15]